jgi:hypothetical protein
MIRTTGKCCRLSVVLIAGLLIGALPRQSIAQAEASNQQSFFAWILSNSRTEITSDYRHASTSGTHATTLQLARAFPMGISRSSLSLQSRISLVQGAVGVQTGPAGDPGVGWSAGLLHGDLYRAPVAMGLTVLDYRTIGRFNLQARWLQFRAGPAIRWENDWAAIEPRIVVSIGGASLKPGVRNYPSLERRANVTVHGFDTSYRVELAARLNYWMRFSASAGQRILLARENLRINRARGELQTVLWSTLELFAQYQVERLHTGGESAPGQYFRSGLRVFL